MLKAARVGAEGNHLAVSNANAVTLLLAADSNYNHKNPLDPLATDFRAQALEQVKAAAALAYAKLKERSIADHQAPVPPRGPATLVRSRAGPADRRAFGGGAERRGRSQS